MIIKDKNIEVLPIKLRKKNVFSPAQIRKAGGVNTIAEKFNKLRNKPMPDLGFSDKEWDLMLKNESL